LLSLDRASIREGKVGVLRLPIQHTSSHKHNVEEEVLGSPEPRLKTQGASPLIREEKNSSWRGAANRDKPG